MIKVLIVDDHSLVRMGISRLLDDLPDIEVVADAESGEKALELVKTVHPDVILLDMKMPGIDGWEVTRRLVKRSPTTKIIAVTALCNDTLPTRVLQLGAKGYLTKESGTEEMAEAIRKVAAGETYLCADVAHKIALNSLSGNSSSPFELLSERELQITLMITDGMAVQEIANQLCLSSKTVCGYRYRSFAKLNIKNDVELTHFAIKHRLIEQPFDDLDG